MCGINNVYLAGYLFNKLVLALIIVSTVILCLLKKTSLLL